MTVPPELAVGLGGPIEGDGERRWRWRPRRSASLSRRDSSSAPSSRLPLTGGPPKRRLMTVRLALITSCLLVAPMASCRGSHAVRGSPGGSGVAAPDTCPAHGQTPIFLTAAAGARCLYQAWKANARADALSIAQANVVDVLFSTKWRAPDYSFQGCGHDPSVPEVVCVFRRPATNDSLVVELELIGESGAQLRIVGADLGSDQVVPQPFPLTTT